jgi:hypothetical protein
MRLSVGCSVAFDHEMPGKFLKEYCSMNGVHHIAGVDMYYPQMYKQWTEFLRDAGGDLEKLPEYIAAADAL